MVTVHTRVLVSGEARGVPLVLTEPLSLWGGFDPETGLVIEPRHPQFGENLKGRIVSLPRGKGSSSSSSILAEAMRKETAPAAIVLGEADPILVIGSLVGSRLYGLQCPIVVAERPVLGAGAWELREDGLLKAL